MEASVDYGRLFEIFHPHAYSQFQRASEQDIRFVHYTNVAAAQSIIQNREVWMRKTSCMNDFTEVQHGLGCIEEAWKSEAGRRLQAALDSAFNGFSAEFSGYFDKWVPHFEEHTYIVCLSEHLAGEDHLGRLSMWRAYGSATGVALVLHGAPLLAPSDALKAYSSPVAYLDTAQFGTEFEVVVKNVEDNLDLLRAAGYDAVKYHMFNALRFAALCTKHPGFREEREWRVVYSPTVNKSEFLEKDVRSIGGIPQPIYKIPLKNIPNTDLVAIEIPQLIERIIIGPTEYGPAIKEAFIDLLQKAGVENPGDRVVQSRIPLR